jgi:hypothetical protein
LNRPNGSLLFSSSSLLFILFCLLWILNLSSLHDHFWMKRQLSVVNSFVSWRVLPARFVFKETFIYLKYYLSGVENKETYNLLLKTNFRF